VFSSVLTSFIEATYEVLSEPDLERRAQSVAVGMTVGSWIDVPQIRQPHLRAYLGEVAAVEQHGAAGRFTIRYPVANVQPNVSTLMTVVFGKLSLDGTIRLVDLRLPSAYLGEFPGPLLGLAGLRQRLKAFSRPLVMSIFKSENGRTLEEFREALKDQLDGGVDLVKDDEIFMADAHCPLVERVQVARDLIADREQRTGQAGLYFANLTGTPIEIMDRAQRAQQQGAMGFLLTPYTQGLDVLIDLRRSGIVVPLIAHPAFSGGQIRPHGFGVAPSLFLGLLPRLAGADVVLYPSPYGSVALDREDALAVRDALVSSTGNIPISVPGPSAGVHVGMLPQLLQDFGPDLVVNAGGAVHGHPDGTTAGARALVDGVRQSLEHLHLRKESDPW
jgi:2,3-diketo-5-methylthiopentyl-1-phosphate enolase